MSFCDFDNISDKLDFTTWYYGKTGGFWRYFGKIEKIDTRFIKILLISKN